MHVAKCDMPYPRTHGRKVLGPFDESSGIDVVLIQANGGEIQFFFGSTVCVFSYSLDQASVILIENLSLIPGIIHSG